jgi:hypothetical protein
MQNETLPPFVQHLLTPEAYPHQVSDVKLVQTHISYVFIAGEFVYKFKKPVDFGFLDFTTLEKRKYFCEQELLLNRRLCPDLYLGTVRVTENNGLALDGAGEAIEYGIKMSRMPEDRMMGNVIKAGQLTKNHIDEIVALLAPFYEKAEKNEEIDSYGTAKSVRVNVHENFEQTASFIGCEALSKERYLLISRYAAEFLENEEIFKQRLAAGKIRECHGDLYSANICLADKVYIYDCIEFNKRFRYCDVASDVAFLAMDLDFYDLGGLSEYLIDRFCEVSEDPSLKEVLNFYKCYRAYVRGKIGLFTAHAPEVDADTKKVSLNQAYKYFKLAEEYATQG